MRFALVWAFIRRQIFFQHIIKFICVGIVEYEIDKIFDGISQVEENEDVDDCVVRATKVRSFRWVIMQACAN